MLKPKPAYKLYKQHYETSNNLNINHTNNTMLKPKPAYKQYKQHYETSNNLHINNVNNTLLKPNISKHTANLISLEIFTIVNKANLS